MEVRVCWEAKPTLTSGQQERSIAELLSSFMRVRTMLNEQLCNFRLGVDHIIRVWTITPFSWVRGHQEIVRCTV